MSTIGILLLLSCSKAPLPNANKIPVPVANTDEAKQRLSISLASSGSVASTTSIVSVQNYQGEGVSFSLVTYLDEAGIEHTIAYRTTLNEYGEEETQTITCSSSSCDCRVQLFQNSSGQMDVQCSCIPCTMTIR